MDSNNRELPLAELRHTCDPAEFPFQTTTELELKDEVFGSWNCRKIIILCSMPSRGASIG